MKYYLRIVTVAVLALFMVQCEVIDSDLLDDPNNPSPTNVDPDFLLNNIQIEGRNVFAGASSDGSEMTRMGYMFGDTYDNAYTSQSFNGIYQNAYADLFVDVENLLPIAEERSLFFHAGMAKVLKAYAMITLVDVFGDVPFSQALDPSNFNPAVDSGSEIYSSAIALLDEAIADLQNENRLGFPANDLYYGDADDQVNAWVRAANTIKMRAHLNTGNTSAFFALVDGDNYISEQAHDFTFQHGLTTNNPDSRHPGFSNNYVDQANDYMSVGYMDILLNDKPSVDPRLRYYMYRQTTQDPFDVNLNTCITANRPSHFEPEDPFCLLGDGWWGRDHLIDDGIPPDGDLRTTIGVYPVGGRFDDGQGEGTEPEQGLQGAGIDPIMMSSFSHFMIAEAELTLNGDEVAAEPAMEQAIRLSLETVRDFGAPAVPDGSGNAIVETTITNYLAEIQDRWDNAGTIAEYLNITSKEFYLAMWPNGYEAYNMFRRTGWGDAGHPDQLQPARSPSPGAWYNTFKYPANLVERNSSVSADDKPRTTTTFWDNGDYDYNY